MFGFLYSQFIEQLGPKIRCTQTQTLPNLFLFVPLQQLRVISIDVICLSVCLRDLLSD